MHKHCYSYCVSGHYSSSCFYLKHIVSETEFWLILQVKPIKLAPISGLQHQHKIGYINQAQHKPPLRVKTSIKNIKKPTFMRPNTYVHALFHGYCC
jgi:hypothetical protein